MLFFIILNKQHEKNHIQRGDRLMDEEQWAWDGSEFHLNGKNRKHVGCTLKSLPH